MSTRIIYDITPHAFDDVEMTSEKDPDVLLLCQELENIVDDFMCMYRLDYTGNMVDLSHDSSSGIESGEAQIPSRKDGALHKSGGQYTQHSQQSSISSDTQDIFKQNGVVFSNPHRRDPSWSTCSDSDMRSGSIFSSSDTDNNARHRNARPPQQRNNGAAPHIGRKTPTPTLQQQQQQRAQTPTRTFKSAPLKSKKHVTFQTANGIDPLSPLNGEDLNQKNTHFSDPNILYYEDDGDVIADQYYVNQQGLKSHRDTVSDRARNVAQIQVSQHRQSPAIDQSRAHRRGHRAGASRPVHQSYHQSDDLQSGYQGSEDEDLTTDTSSELPTSRTPLRELSRKTPSPRTLTPVPNGHSDVFFDSKKGKSRLSYMDLLPDDVLVKIFSHMTSDQLCSSVPRACRRWYMLAYTPTLWTTIRINNETVNVDKALKVLTRRLSYDTPTVCVMVEKINLNGCSQLTDKGLYTIAKRCPELTHLEITGCPNVTNIAMFELVSRCVNLEHLNTSGCENITCISLTPQATVQAQTYGKQIDLRYIDMSDCIHLEDSGLQIIASYCSQLVYLYLRRCVKVTDIGVQYVANYCSNLKELSICECKNVTDFGLKELSKLGSNLRYLSAAKCMKITDYGVKQIAKHCHRLRYLNVRGCEGVSDDAIETLARNCPRLRSLDIGKCDITDDSLHMLAEHCAQLRKLSLKSCDAITDKGITSVAERCRLLAQLNIQECHVTVNAYRTVKALCKRCLIEHTNPGFY